MSKLFSKEDNSSIDEIIPGRLTRNGEEILVEDLNLNEIHEDFSDFNSLATEHMADLQYKLHKTNQLLHSFGRSEIGTKEYLYGLEDRSESIRNLASNLGVTVHVAALEDFHSEWSMKSCHEVAVEGIKSFFVKIWEKIKAFFKKFWRNVTNFFKRVSGANLEMDKYEKYVDDLIRKVKRDKLVCKTPEKKLSSNLPSMVNPISQESGEVEIISSSYKLVSDNMKRFAEDKLIRVLNGLKSGKRSIRELESLVKGVSSSFLSDRLTEEDIVSELSNSMAIVLGSIKVLTSNRVSFNEVVDEVQEKLGNRLGRNSNQDIFVAVPLSDRERLPSYLNIYLNEPYDFEKIVRGIEKYLESSDENSRGGVVGEIRDMYSSTLVASIREDLPKANMVDVLPTIERIEDFHTHYKNTKVDVRKIESLVHDVSKLLDSLIETCSKDLSISDVNTKVGDKASEDINPFKGLKTQDDLARYFRELGNEEQNALIKILDNLGLMSTDLENGYEEVIDNPQNRELVEGWLEEVSKLDVITSVSDSEKIVIVDLMRAYEETMVRSLEAYRTMLSETLVQFSDAQNKLRYEAIKYMYDSLRTYG